MNGTEKFKMQLDEPWGWENLAPPEDPLGELSNLEMRLRRFCFECNHRVSIEVGERKFDVFLDPDIILILADLPQKISELSRGKKIEIEFPESYREIAFMPVDGEIRCTLRRFGQAVQRQRFLLERTQVLEALRGFLEELVCLALDGGYVSPEQGHEFLTEMRTHVPLCRSEHTGLPKRVNRSECGR